MTTTIAWGDGTGDNIYLTYTEASGNQTILVSSDAYSGATTRSKDITFTASGVSSVTLTVNQTAQGIMIITRNDVAVTYDDVAVGYQQ